MKKPFNTKGELSKWWKNFFVRINQYSELPVNEWKEEQIVGYVCSKFKQAFNTDFAFSLSGAPSKCREVFYIKKTMLMLGTTSNIIMKDYIDWVFDKKINGTETQISSFGFFANSNVCNQYKIHLAKKNKITRATLLPKDILDIATEHNVDVTTYGELSFVKQTVDQTIEGLENYVQFLDRIKRIPFDLSIVDNLEE